MKVFFAFLAVLGICVAALGYFTQIFMPEGMALQNPERAFGLVMCGFFVGMIGFVLFIGIALDEIKNAVLKKNNRSEGEHKS